MGARVDDGAGPGATGMLGRGRMSVVAAMLLVAGIGGAVAEVLPATPAPLSAKDAGRCPAVSASLVEQGSEVLDGEGTCYCCAASVVGPSPLSARFGRRSVAPVSAR